MTYAAGGIIEAVDFNRTTWGSNTGGTYTNALNNLAYIHGTGYGRYGYGQSTSPYTQVAINSTVTAAQWSGLINGVNSSLSLQGSANISPGSVTAGGTITYYSTIVSGVDTAWTAANTANVGSTSANVTTSVTGTTDWGGATERRTRFTFTCTWANADQARYWWNAGGRIHVTCALTTGGTTRNTDWSSLASAVGNVVIGYNTTTKSGGSGTVDTIKSAPLTGGYWLGTAVAGSHSGTSTLQFRQYSANAPYTTDHIAITTNYSGSTSNGGYPVMTIVVDWENDYASTFQQTVGNAPTTRITPFNPVATAFGTALVAPSVVGTYSNE
jgi:hypothetical protein